MKNKKIKKAKELIWWESKSITEKMILMLNHRVNRADKKSIIGIYEKENPRPTPTTIRT